MTMQSRSRLLRFGVRPLVLWGAVFLIGWFSQLPRLAPEESAAIAGRFRFERERFPRMDGPARSYRNVNRRLERINGWISTVGAGIALGDLDGDGLSNDTCLVDPRTDDVIITPVPGTGQRYRPFALTPGSLPYDPSSMAPMGCLLVDLNEDGLRDVVVYYWGRPPIAFLRRSEAQPAALSRASFVAQELVPGSERWYTNAGLVADIDGDGHADLIFGNYFPDGSVVLGKDGPIEMHTSMSRAGNGGSKPILLWKSATAGDKPSVQFSRAANLDSVLGHGWTLAMGACDIDGDLRPDIYIANDLGSDVVLHNLSTPGQVVFQRLRGHRGWTTPKSKVLGQDSFKGMGVDCADLNGDGLPDFLISNITDSYALEESNLLFVSTGDLKTLKDGVAPYRERGESMGLARSGWSWDVRFGDFDNDGVPEVVQATGFLKGSVNRWPELQELAMGNDLMLRDPSHWPRFAPGDDLSGNDHDRFYVRSSSGRYFDLAPQVGLGEPYMTRGVAVADVDGDGRLDFVLANQWADSFLFHNVGEPSGKFLGLHVLLPVPPAPVIIRDGHDSGPIRGYPALGARVTVYLPDGRRLVEQVDGGNGHSGKSSPDLHFGLGAIGSSHLLVAFDWRDRQGTVRHWETSLTPGWHTVFLGSSEK
jgi:enediyne biosynthesis protein E4